MAQAHRLLIVTHNLGGGVERHVSDLQALLSGVLQTELLRSVDDRTVSLEMVGAEPVFWRFADWADVVRALRQRGYDWISFQHVHGFPSQILALANALALPYDLTLHDFFPYCPIYSLSTVSGDYCGEPDVNGCAKCIRHRPNAWHWSINHWRSEMGQLLAGATRITAPSRFVADRIQKHFPDVQAIVWAHPPREEWIWPPPPMKKILLLGKLTRLKGLDRLLACAKRSRDEKLGLAFCVLGFTDIAIPAAENLQIQVRGEYADRDLPQLLALERPDVIWYPGPYPETYCYTLDAALGSGIPIVASKFGAIAERLQGYGGALVLAVDAEPQAWCEALLAAANLPHQARLENAGNVALQARREYRNKFMAPILARPPKAQSVPDKDWLAAQIEVLAQAPSQGELSVSVLFEHGVECGHLESRLALKGKLADIEREGAVRDGYTKRGGAPWFELLDRAETQAAENRQLGHDLYTLREDSQTYVLQIETLARRLEVQDALLRHNAEEMQAHAAELAWALGRIAELEASTSWRVTAPLRVVSRLGQQLRHKVRRQTALVQHTASRLPLAWKILRSDGLRALLHRLQTKLGTQQFIPSPESSTALVPIGKLVLPTCGADMLPRVSIVIPVYGHHDHTFNCLNSILACTRLDDVEIIVVDDASPVPASEALKGVSGAIFLRASQNSGFIESCRLGAERARGEFLILLNNDVQVTTGWLDNLLDVFRIRSDAGLVGARLVYPDGRLQEAGAIVWQDGSAWNWGRGDDPDRPEYRYLRAVDYCSGACLAIRMSDWRGLGGFDKAYAPAYYEDTDLAFRVRQLGKQVYYQPEAKIVHFEGVSSGTDLATGIKRHQVINRSTFLARWDSVLKLHHRNGHQPQREADRGAKARVLVVEACMITPDQDAGSVRMLAMLELLVELGCKVSFIADNIEYRQPYVRQLQQSGIEVWHHPFVNSVAQFIAERGKTFDVIMFCRYYIAARYLSEVRSWAPQAKIVFDTVDLHYLREQRLAKLDGSKALHDSAQATRQRELGVIKGSDLTLVVSSVEKELLAQELPSAAVDILTIIHETRQANQPFAQRTGLLFVGGFRHPPNADAVNWFVNEVWPLVQHKQPDITLTIVGSNMPGSIREISAPNVVVAGFVHDIDPLLDSARISIAPLRYGAGIKGKVNQAMACGLPVVATTIAVEGMDLIDNEDLLIADSPEAFADSVIRLYNDEELWNYLAERGKRNIEVNFSRTRAKCTLAELVGVQQAQRQTLPVDAIVTIQSIDGPSATIVINSDTNNSLLRY